MEKKSSVRGEEIEDTSKGNSISRGGKEEERGGGEGEEEGRRGGGRGGGGKGRRRGRRRRRRRREEEEEEEEAGLFYPIGTTQLKTCDIPGTNVRCKVLSGLVPAAFILRMASKYHILQHFISYQWSNGHTHQCTAYAS